MKIKYTIFAIVIIILLLTIRASFLYGERNDRDKYNTSFKGMVVKKERRRGDIIFYKDFATNQIREIYASGELQDKSVVGDTILKLENSNECTLRNREKLLHLKCYYGLDY